jgi:hypothetical protein
VGATGQGISGHAEDAVGGAVRGSDRHALAVRIHYGGRDVEGVGDDENLSKVRSTERQNLSEKGGCMMKIIDDESNKLNYSKNGIM